MPLFGSRAPVLDRTWCIRRWIGGGVVLRRAERTARWSKARISPNKVVGDLLVAALLLLLNLLLAGHGGGAKKVGGRAASSPGGGRGGVPAVVLRRGTTRSLEGSFVKIPWRKMTFCGWMVSSLNKKRLYRLLITVFVVLLLLAGRGGEGEVGTGLTVAGFGRWRPCTLCLVKHNEFLMIQVLQSGCYTSEPLQAVVHVVFAIFESFELMRRRRVRASPKWLLRFSGEDTCVLSSVMHPLDLQVNPLPRMNLPTQLLVEPLALRLARLQEAPEEHNCRLFASAFLLDLLAGSFCVLLLRQYGLMVAYCECVHLGTLCVNSDFQSTSCSLSCDVIVLLS